MDQRLYCYQVPAIDFFEGPLLTFSLVGDEDSDISRLWDAARAGFEALGIGERLREGPYLFHVPHGGWMRLCLLLKEDNNGSTYIASSVPLPFLHDSMCSVREATVTRVDVVEAPRYEAALVEA